MWVVLFFGVIPGFLVAWLFYKSPFQVLTRGICIGILLLVSLYFLGKLVYGPPVFYWQPPLMIPNTVFYLTPFAGYFFGALLINQKWSKPKLTAKYQNSSVTPGELDTLQQKLQQLMNSEKVYLEHDISLEGLANRLHSDRHTVSRLINERFGKNFFNFINSYRVQHFIELVGQSTPGTENYFRIARQVGFRTKTSFIKAFKKEKQLTPSQYFSTQ